MVKTIYSLKIYLFRAQIKYNAWTEKLGKHQSVRGSHVKMLKMQNAQVFLVIKLTGFLDRPVADVAQPQEHDSRKFLAQETQWMKMRMQSTSCSKRKLLVINDCAERQAWSSNIIKVWQNMKPRSSSALPKMICFKSDREVLRFYETDLIIINDKHLICGVNFVIYT